MFSRLPKLPVETANAILSSLGLPTSKDVKMDAMAALHRPDAFEVPPPPFTWFKAFGPAGAAFPYSSYNEILEAWLHQNYTVSPPPPFVDSLSDRTAARYLDLTFTAQYEQMRRAVLNLSHVLRRSDIASGRQGKARMNKWLAMSEKERESVLLDIWERYQVISEELNTYDERMECPELTLKILAHNGGKGMMKLLLDCITVPFGLPLTEFPLVRNDDYDRLLRVGKFEPKMPLSPAKRAYVQQALAWRHKGLFTFCLRWISIMDGKGDIPLGERAPEVVPFNESTAPTLAASVSKRAFADMQKRAQEFSPQKAQCDRCGKREGGSEEVHLLCCSRCKDAPDGGRSVFYCGRECQKLHFPAHKTVCNTPLGSHPAATSLPSHEVARHPEQALPSSSPLLAMGDPKSVRVICDPNGEVVWSYASFLDDEVLPLPAELAWHVIGNEGWEPHEEENEEKDAKKRLSAAEETGKATLESLAENLAETDVEGKKEA